MQDGWAASEEGWADENLEHAEALLEQGDVAGARACLEEVLAVEPAHPTALTLLGVAHQGAGRLDEAVACFTRVLESEPNNAGAIVSLFTLYLARGRTEEASALLEHNRDMLLPDDFEALQAQVEGFREKLP